jgi:hypothetical protein
MNPLGIALVGLGAVLIAVGYLRAREPWRRYQALREQDRNVARYEAWRGGLRNDGKTGASVAMELLRGQARIGGAIVIAGFILIVLGFLIT